MLYPAKVLNMWTAKDAKRATGGATEPGIMLTQKTRPKRNASFMLMVL
jgi:hypothetical protein